MTLRTSGMWQPTLSTEKVVDEPSVFTVERPSRPLKYVSPSSCSYDRQSKTREVGESGRYSRYYEMSVTSSMRFPMEHGV